MKTTTRNRIATVVALACLAAFTLVTPGQAAEPAGMKARLEEVMRLSKNPRFRDHAQQQLRELRQLAPHDARVPYAYALGLIERLDYRGALVHVKETVRLDSGHLNAWKTRIWLAAATREFTDAMNSMEKLTGLMPASEATGEVERTCQEFCGFMGKVFGYLEGPQGNTVETLQLTSSKQRIVGHLTPARKSIFDAGHTQVMNDFLARSQQINGSRDVARQRDAAFRTTRLSQLKEEQGFAYQELDKLEDLRLAQQKIAADERSVIAATREKAGGRTIAVAGTRYRDSEEKGPIYRRSPLAKKDDKYTLDHNYDRYRRYNHGRGLSSSFATDKGLGRPEYWNSVNEQKKYSDRLDKRERSMHRRVSRIAKERAQLLGKPNLGSNDLVRAANAKAKALRTYVAVPINTTNEAQTLFASYQN